MTDRSLLTVTLAAGLGTRMKSALPKVLHQVAGRSMLAHVLALGFELGADSNAVVIGPEMAELPDFSATETGNTRYFVQKQRRGTAHAVLAAEQAIKEPHDDVIILYGDTPLLTEASLEALRAALGRGASLVVLGFQADDPTGYGRLITTAGGDLIAIREEKDATAGERAVTFANSGVFAFSGEHLLALLNDVGNDNASGEYYLTDTVEIARNRGLKVVAVTGDQEEVLGVNSRSQLAAAELVLQRRLREKAMAAGATLIDPESVYFSFDTAIGSDVIIEPNVFFGPGVTIGDDVRIKGFSHIEQAHISSGAVIGPYARLRPGAEIGENAKVGNFVEIKQAVVETGAKVNHLTYIGDTRVGAGANIGAGTITCNYDGFSKHRTDIGAGAFIGSNSSLIAPVKIGDGAYIGSGSVITRDVEPDTLTLTRAATDSRPGWAAKFRARARRASKK